MVVNNDIINVNSFFIYLYVDLSENYFKIYLLLITYIYIYCCVLNECSSITNSFESNLCVCIRYIHNIVGHGFCCYNNG